jgi:hypothetical protein
VDTNTSSTNHTTQQRQAGIVAHAFRALAEHFDHRALIAPAAVTVTDTALFISLPPLPAGSDAGDLWAVTLADGDGIRCADIANGRAFFETGGRLPDTGVRVRVVWSKPIALEAVPA